MSNRGRFKVPTASQLNNDKNEISSMSLFSNYKLKKSSGELDKTKEDGKVERQTATSSSGSSILKTNQKPATGTSSVPQSVTSSGPPSDTSSVKVTSSASTVSSTPVIAPASNSTTVPAPVVTGSKPGSGNSIIVNFRQRGNPILKHIRNVPWEYGSIVPDYVMGKANCALYLGLRYHQLHPEYIHKRLQDLGKGYDLRVLLAQVDVNDPHHLLKDLAKICILADLTLILAFSAEEAGRYLESYKVYENKPAEALMEKTETDFMSKVNDCLTTVKAVNKTDCMTLMSSFKSVEGIVNASKEDLSMCAGFGPHKAQRLYNVLHESFVKGRKRRSNSPTKTDGTAGSSPMKKPG